MAEPDSDVDEVEETEYPWATQTPHTRISGIPTGIIYSDRLGDDVQQNDTSYGLILKDAEVVIGSAWTNDEKGDGTMADVIGDDEPRPTDYRIVDTGDEGTTTVEVDGETFVSTGEKGPNTYAEGTVEDDEVLIWYNGGSGERISRVLDFNGRPYARWTDDEEPYLVKGLYQPPEGYREADAGERRKMELDPRVVRAPILRQQVYVERNDDGDVIETGLLDEPNDQRVLIDVSRFMGGRAYEVHVFDADGFADEFGALDAEIPRTDDGYAKNDIDSELEMSYTPSADGVLEDAEYAMHMYTGDGWANEPEGWSANSTAEVDSFGISSDLGDDEGLSPSQEQFVNEVVGELKGTGLTPKEAFDGGLGGLITNFAEQFDEVPRAADVREPIYERVAHLDPDDLDDDGTAAESATPADD